MGLNPSFISGLLAGPIGMPQGKMTDNGIGKPVDNGVSLNERSHSAGQSPCEAGYNAIIFNSEELDKATDSD